MSDKDVDLSTAERDAVHAIVVDRIRVLDKLKDRLAGAMPDSRPVFDAHLATLKSAKWKLGEQAFREMERREKKKRKERRRTR